mgnify:FL=1
MSVSNYVYIVIGFEIESEEAGDYEENRDFSKKGFNVYRSYEDTYFPPVFGRSIKGCYADAEYIEDFPFSLTPKDLQDEIDFTRKLMEDVVDDIKDLKLHVVAGCA